MEVIVEETSGEDTEDDDSEDEIEEDEEAVPDIND